MEQIKGIARDGVRRRNLFGLFLAGTLPLLNPSTDRNGFVLVREAQAVWLQVATLALSAISSFSQRGDGGVGAYLQNIKELSEQNIRLTQKVLVGIGEIQSELAALPERLRQVFLEVRGYDLKQGAQTSFDKLRLVEDHYKINHRLSSDDIRDCQWIMDKCSEMTGARSTPYGRGGTAAACIALIGSIEARAAFYLKRNDDFRRRVTIAYLPWFEEIFTDQDGSLLRYFLTEGQALSAQSETALSDLPDQLKSALAPVWKAAISSDPGTFRNDLAVACGNYGRQTGTTPGKCISYECTGRYSLIADSHDKEVFNKILKSQELTTEEILHVPRNPQTGHAQTQGRKMTETNVTPLACFCDVRDSPTPIFTPQTGADLMVTISNVKVDEIPQIGLSSLWQQREPAACPTFATGLLDTADQQFANLRDSPRAVDLIKSIERFNVGGLAKYNDQRAIVYSTYLLLNAARGAYEQFKQVAI